MSENQQLRESFANNETRQWAERVDHADPKCPACGNNGVPTSDNYYWNWFECVTPDCRTTTYDINIPGMVRAENNSPPGESE